MQAEHQVRQIMDLLDRRAKTTYFCGKWVRVGGRWFYSAHWLLAMRLRVHRNRLRRAHRAGIT